MKELLQLKYHEMIFSDIGCSYFKLSKAKEKCQMSNFALSTVPADGLAMLGITVTS